MARARAKAAAASSTGAPDKKTSTTAPIAAGGDLPVKERAQDKPEATTPKPSGDTPLAPSVRKMSAESGVDPSGVAGSGKDGRVTKGDMMAAIETRGLATGGGRSAGRRRADARAVARR